MFRFSFIGVYGFSPTTRFNQLQMKGLFYSYLIESKLRNEEKQKSIEDMNTMVGATIPNDSFNLQHSIFQDENYLSQMSNASDVSSNDISDDSYLREEIKKKSSILNKNSTQEENDIILTKKDFTLKCSLCEKEFSNSKKLKKHMKIHMGDRPYQCTECDKAFSQNSTLKVHLRTHTGEKPYKCSQCDTAFSDNSTLIRHMTIHTGDRHYQCSQCDKA
ncbi:unnamed protein product, partial [Meganyctiphanes norvegica]